MTALNPIASKALGSKLGSMQMLLLTAMTLLGFYLCFKEIRRMTMEMASLRDQFESAGGHPRGPSAGGGGGGGGLADGGGLVMVVDDEAADEGMDEGLRQMLEQLNGMRAGQPPPPVEVEVEEIDIDAGAEEAEAEAEGEGEAEAEGDEDGERMTPESLMAKTKAEIEELLRGHGVPFKKSDAKAKLVEALLEAMDASGDGEEDGMTLEEAVAADDQ